MSPPNHPNRSKGNRSLAGNPTIAEIKRAREDAGLSQEQAAELVHASVRSWENWETEATMENSRRMPPSVWDLFTIKLAAREQLKRKQITTAELRRLGIFLPNVD